ncbi:MAG: response regulator transcription factor [Bacteroidales bacterium]|nr:response regulator transcription factor [Bacteroidales bacterium]MBN2698579.1 response regulator transcription factor [Bacteroidales bacterium]
MNILLVEDDIDLQKVLAQYLELSGFKVTTANHGKHGLEKFIAGHFDICIFDVMMPVMDGFTLAAKIITMDPGIPVIFLTAKNQKEDRLKGLKLGADDYITKPFEAEELVLRINNILKRSGKTESETVQLGRLEIRFDELLIKDSENDYQLTPREGELLRYLLNNPNRVLKREEILTSLWGQNDYFMGRSMDVFISRLRKYLGGEPIVKLDTVRGIGFILKVKATAD